MPFPVLSHPTPPLSTECEAGGQTRAAGIAAARQCLGFLVAYLFSDNRNGKGWEAHLSYYTSAYNRVETNQPPQDLFINLM